MNDIASHFSIKQTMNCNGQLIDLAKPVAMGIVNVTPDSFYGQSRFTMRYRIARRAKQIVAEGGAIIDIGACSTRPGAKLVDEKEEMKRLDRALSVVRKAVPNAIISVDTFRASVAKRMVENFGANIINDISAGEMDADMFATIAKLNVPYVLMHMQGTPASMQVNPQYTDVVRDIFGFFNKKVEALKLFGVNDVFIDPGFGFGKTIAHNYSLLTHLSSFRMLELPLVAGLSRKSLIYKALGITPSNALNGTTVLNTMALLGGANILRVHDVKQAVETIELFSLAKLK